MSTKKSNPDSEPGSTKRFVWAVGAVLLAMGLMIAADRLAWF